MYLECIHMLSRYLCCSLVPPLIDTRAEGLRKFVVEIQISPLCVLHPCECRKIGHECREEPITLPPGLVRFIHGPSGPPEQPDQSDGGHGGKDRDTQRSAIPTLPLPVTGHPADSRQEENHT